MTIVRGKARKTKGGRQGSNSNDYISQMADDILLIILSLLPIKDAAVTSSLSTRWRFLWLKLISLNFDGSETLDKIGKDPVLLDVKRIKFSKQVFCVIRSYNNPMVKDFRICFDLDYRYGKLLDDWIVTAMCKKVETLELDLTKNSQMIRRRGENYNFPLWVLDRKRFISHVPRNAVEAMASLKKLLLKSVNLFEASLHMLLTSFPNIDSLSIHGSECLVDIDVGGRSLNLKRLEITDCYRVKSIYLHDFGLVTFSYKGPLIHFGLRNLPNLEELRIYGDVKLENNVFGEISSFASNLKVLTFKIHNLKASHKFFSCSELPNVKNLRMIVRAREDNSLLELTKMATKCPILESFAIELLWSSPKRRRRKVRDVGATQPHKHLKVFQFLGYYGRISDLELVSYIIQNASLIKKIVIDPHCQSGMLSPAVKNLVKIEEASRSSAKRQLESLTPQGVELVIL